MALGAILLTSLCALTSCHQPPPTIDGIVHTYVSLAVQLGARDPDSLDFHAGNDDTNVLQKENPQPLANLHRQAIALRNQLDNLPPYDPARNSFLRAQLEAIIFRVNQLSGTSNRFDEESRAYFGVIAPPDTQIEARKQIRNHLAQLLGNPDSKDLPAAYTHFDAQFIVQPARVPAVMTEALQQCRALTLQHLTLPANEVITLEYVSHKPWSAFSRYRGYAQSTIQVNMDYPLTLDRILSLACHEGYPGHHVFNVIRDQALAEYHREFKVQPTFSPQSYISEAAASYAPTLVLTDADRLQIERDILAPIAGITPHDLPRYLEVQRLVASLHTAEPAIARAYLDGDLEFVRAANALERETLMQHPEPALLYLNEFRTYVLAYTTGADSVEAFIEANHPTEAERWQRYASLITNPVTSIPPPSR